MVKNSARSILLTLSLLTLAAAIAVPVSGLASENPFVSATASALSVAPGDTLTISGTATPGAAASTVTPGVRIWIFGDNFGKVALVPVKADGSFTYSLDTTGMALQQYYVYVQHPVGSGFAIDYNAASGYVYSTLTGRNLFQYSGGNVTLSGSDTAAEIMNALNEKDVDDIYTKLSFSVTTPQAAGVMTAATTPAPSRPPTLPLTTKSPVSPLVALLGAGIASLVLILMRRG
jgi:hypothetical protein